jgi:hypothetical protein
MNWPNIRKFPVSAKTLIAIYTLLMGSILVVALALSSWHHGLVTEKAAASAAPEAAAPAPVKAVNKPDDGQSSGVVIEPDSDAPVKVKTQDWFIYENFKLGHTHLNGQTLVYFSLMALFLMSTASERSKIGWGVLLAFAVVLHTFGLFFMHKELFAMLLRISGGLLSLSIMVMCGYIFADTLQKVPLS